jgi:hypothetical protein
LNSRDNDSCKEAGYTSRPEEDSYYEGTTKDKQARSYHFLQRSLG